MVHKGPRTPSTKQLRGNKITRKAEIKLQKWHGYFRAGLDCKENRHVRQKLKPGLSGIHHSSVVQYIFLSEY